ncbi:MAG: peptidase [Pirellulaceae bacterium]
MNESSQSSSISRRKLLRSASVAAISGLAMPAIVTAKRSEAQQVIGDGDFKFKVQHQWPELPDQFTWQTTHNVAVDADNCLYVIHEGRAEAKDHPSIFVFDPEGRYMRSFGQQFQGGGHGIEVRREGNDQFLYVAAYQQVKSFAKLSLKGETVWQKYAPMESGKYAEGEATNPQKVWGKDRFLPTNFAFLDDGGFLLADGYGAFYIHRYDKDANWVSCFGGPGDGQGTFKTPHGLWIDRRGETPTIVVTDRAHGTLQRFTLDGQYIDTLTGYGLPANIDTRDDLMLVPELVARLSILDKDCKVIAHIGEDVSRLKADGKKTIRSNPSLWQDGKFVHPHDACFDNNGDIFVAEWVATGRITKLTRA